MKYFHVCDGSLIPDVMHDVLEGVLQYKVKLMLRHMITIEQYFSLDMVIVEKNFDPFFCTEKRG